MAPREVAARRKSFAERWRAAGKATQAQIEAYYNSDEYKRDCEAMRRAEREYRERQVEAAFRVRADELAAMAPPTVRTEGRSRERRDAAGRSSSRGGDSGDPDLSEPELEHLAAGAIA